MKKEIKKETMETDIINYIANSPEIIKVLDIENIFPLFAVNPEATSLVFNFTPYSSGYVNIDNLKIKIISKDYEKANEIIRILKRILTMKETEFIPTGNTFFNSSINGGGDLYNDSYEAYEKIINFTIKWRCIKK